MRHSLIPLSTLALLVAATTAFAAPDTGLTGIVPAAQDWNAQSGTFSLNADKVVITVAKKDAAALKSVAEALRDDLTPQGFPNIEIVTGGESAPGGVFLFIMRD